MKPPLIYYGGKSLLYKDILAILPPHRTWVDVFGGGGVVTLMKPPSPMEVLNDIGFVQSFWHCLQDQDKARELIWKLRATPWSRKEFYDSESAWRTEDNDIEKARKWFILINQGFTHEETCNSWLISKLVNAAEAFANRVDDLPLVVKRLQRITLECSSFEGLIPLWDAPDTLFYCDPPYVASTRRSGGGGYENEMDEDQHRLLLEMLHSIKGQAVVSGYSSPLYDEGLKDWRKIRVMRQSQIHDGSKSSHRKVVECIWIKENSNGTLWEVPVQTERTHSDVS